MVWFQILEEVTEGDLTKIVSILKYNHHLVFRHIIYTDKKNKKLKREMEAQRRKSRI